jgi:enoyl-[acyl-carrier protein] reductase/trans-2-enoyl-CoA reductase (NAD+)
VDELEMDPKVQAAVAEAWSEISTENLISSTDFRGYKQDFLNLFGFDVDGVDYQADVDPQVEISNLV